MHALLGRMSFRDGPVPTLEFAWSASAIPPGLGPSADFWKTNKISLGHLEARRGQKNGGVTQPYVHSATPVVITADIRLDNSDDLQRALGLGSDAEATAGDVEIALSAYLKWGDAFVDRLYGEFAIAIWDGRDQKLLCARDAFGVKPLYYHHCNAHFTFASHIEDLLRMPSMPNRLDFRYVRTELLPHFNHHPKYTFYEGVHKLEPGHALSVSAAGLRIWRHWRPENLENTRMRSEEEYRIALRDFVTVAVDRRMGTAARAGAHVSGGLDSSAISVLASRAFGKPGFPVFPWAPPPRAKDRPLNDERKDIECLAEREHLSVIYSQLTAEDMLAETARDITRFPSVDFAWEAVVCRNAAQRNIDILLSGWGGDEAASFNGRGFYASLLLTGRWWKLLREIHMKAMLHDIPRWALIRNRVLRPLFPESMQRRLSGAPKIPDPFPLPQGLAPDFAELLARAEPYSLAGLTERPGVHRMQRRLLGWGHLPFRMDAWAVRGLEFGIEHRYPLLDRKLVEFALTIPDHYYVKHGWKRYLFRRAMEGVLPDETLRKKVKADPAMWRANKALQPRYGELLTATLHERRETIKGGGLVDADELIAAAKLTCTENRPPPVTDVYAPSLPEWQTMSLLWLAFLSPETTVS